MKHKNKHVDPEARDWKTACPFHNCPSSPLQTIYLKFHILNENEKKGCGYRCAMDSCTLHGPDRRDVT